MLDEPLSVKVERWRQMAAAGTLGDDDLAEAVKTIRQGRITAAQTSTKSRAAKAPVDIDALEAGLDDALGVG